MPRRDGTGPDGGGPKTGRGLGPCKPSKTKPGQRKVTRRGAGPGRPRRRRNS
jgi:hypothetical protein